VTSVPGSHVVVSGEFDGAQSKHPAPGCGDLEHLLERDAMQLAGRRHDARVGGEHPGDVGVDLAPVRPEGRCQCHRRRVGAASAERRDVASRGNTLETRHHRHRARRQGLTDAFAPHLDDAGFGVEVVGDDAGLAAGERRRRYVPLGECHADQCHRDALAGGPQHVHLTSGDDLGDLVGEVEKLVGRLAHGAHDDDDVVAGAFGAGDVVGDGLDPIGVCHRGATVFLHDEGHGDKLPGSGGRLG
jgi:hypothetical protein